MIKKTKYFISFSPIRLKLDLSCGGTKKHQVTEALTQFIALVVKLQTVFCWRKMSTIQSDIIAKFNGMGGVQRCVLFFSM